MPTKYIQHFPKPVLDDLVTGKWLPVVGAGLSLNASVPQRKKMLLWARLGKALADELPDFASNGTLDAISAYECEFGRARLIERLLDLLLIKEAQPGNAHREFCTIPFDIVCTTNFDFLLERQYDLTQPIGIGKYYAKHFPPGRAPRAPSFSRKLYRISLRSVGNIVMR